MLGSCSIHGWWTCKLLLNQIEQIIFSTLFQSISHHILLLPSPWHNFISMLMVLCNAFSNLYHWKAAKQQTCYSYRVYRTPQWWKSSSLDHFVWSKQIDGQIQVRTSNISNTWTSFPWPNISIWTKGVLPPDKSYHSKPLISQSRGRWIKWYIRGFQYLSENVACIMIFNSANLPQGTSFHVFFVIQISNLSSASFNDCLANCLLLPYRYLPQIIALWKCQTCHNLCKH